MQVGSKTEAKFQCFAIPPFEVWEGWSRFLTKNQVQPVAEPMVFNWLEAAKIRGVLKRNKRITITDRDKTEDFLTIVGWSNKQWARKERLTLLLKWLLNHPQMGICKNLPC